MLKKMQFSRRCFRGIRYKGKPQRLHIRYLSSEKGVDEKEFSQSLRDSASDSIVDFSIRDSVSAGTVNDSSILVDATINPLSELTYSGSHLAMVPEIVTSNHTHLLY